MPSRPWIGSGLFSLWYFGQTISLLEHGPYDMNRFNFFLYLASTILVIDYAGRQLQLPHPFQNFRFDLLLKKKCPEIEPKPEATYEKNALCVVCMDQGRNVLLMPCQHFCLCSLCFEEMFPGKTTTRPADKKRQQLQKPSFFQRIFRKTQVQTTIGKCPICRVDCSEGLEAFI